MVRLLVIEDDFFMAAHIDNLLIDEGIDVVGPVGTLDEAKLLAHDEPLDGALLDINIVGGRVDDVADILTDREVPFLFVTGGQNDDLPRGHREAAVVYKPFRDSDLMRQVRLLTLQRRKQFA